MRELLFRGKATNFNKIVYGDLITVGDTYRIREHTKYHYNDILIDAETLGQFIGRLDESGVKIFDGDIVEVTYTHMEEETTEKSRVIYDVETCSYSPWDWQYDCEGCCLELEIITIKVIGNIY